MNLHEIDNLKEEREVEIGREGHLIEGIGLEEIVDVETLTILEVGKVGIVDIAIVMPKNKMNIELPVIGRD